MVCQSSCKERKKEMLRIMVKEMPLRCYTVLIFRDCSIPSGYTVTTLGTNLSSLQCVKILKWCSQTMELTTKLLW